MSNTAFSLLVLAPVLIGGIVAALNADASNTWTERAEAWLRARQRATAQSSGWFKGYVVNPLLWTIVKFCDWTDGFTHRGLKNGARIAAALYILGAWLLALYLAVVVVIAVVIMVIAFYVAFKIIGSMGETEGDRADSRSSDIAERQRGSRSYRKTGMFSEEEAGRTDETGRVFSKTGMFSEEEVGRIDHEGRTFNKTGLFSEEETGRTDAEGRIFRKTGMFSEEEVGRVDESGKVFKKTGMFSEEETGRYEKT